MCLVLVQQCRHGIRAWSWRLREVCVDSGLWGKGASDACQDGEEANEWWPSVLRSARRPHRLFPRHDRDEEHGDHFRDARDGAQLVVETRTARLFADPGKIARLPGLRSTRCAAWRLPDASPNSKPRRPWNGEKNLGQHPLTDPRPIMLGQLVRSSISSGCRCAAAGLESGSILVGLHLDRDSSEHECGGLGPWPESYEL